MSRILVIGLDGMSPQLLDLLVQWGMAPNIERFRQEGVHGELESTFPASTGPAWVSFATGVNPGVHGVFDFVHPRGSLQSLEVLTSTDIHSRTFYEILHEDGKRIILVNLPLSSPPLIDSPFLASFTTSSDEQVFPPWLKGRFPELLQYRIFPERSSRGNAETYVNDVRNVERTRQACSLRLMRFDWDLFFVLFSGTDWLSHYRYKDLLSGEAERCVFEFFQDIDSYVGDLWAQSGRDTNVFLLSDHGFRTTSKLFMINEWLAREGYLKKMTGVHSKSPHSLAQRQRQQRIDVTSLAWMLDVPVLSRFVLMLHRGLRGIVPFSVKVERSFDARTTKAAAVSRGCMGIHINASEVFAGGIVGRDEYEPMREDLIQGLRNLREPHTGLLVFRNVWKREEVFHGRQVTHAPDVLFQPRRDFKISTSLVTPDLAMAVESNVHDPIGVFAAAGPDIGRGKIRRTIRLTDLAPTFLHLYGVPVPDNIEGQVLHDILREASPARRRKVRYEGAQDPQRSAGDQPFKDAATIERLKGLGYID